jgi:peptide/nickel transport system ATP-binding protein/oligopeptide transport system ATP-binding protein
MSDALIRVRDLKKYYTVKSGNRDAVVKALDGVSLDIIEGEILGVVGESGCGKSTLGRCIMHLTDITEGSVTFRGQELSKYNKKDMKQLRRHMQMVFQNPYSSFNPKQTIYKALVDVGMLYHMNAADIKARIEELLSVIGLDDAALGRRPGELSGGQLQRLAVARALFLKPEFIMADEPVSALDVSVQAQILNLLLKLKQSFSMTMMFISHELTVVEHICDRVLVMYLGAVMEMGSTDALFSRTMHPYTEALLSSKPKDNPDDQTDRIILKGDVPSALHMPPFCRFSTRCPNFIKGKCDAQTPPLVQISDDHWVACHLYDSKQ